MKKIFAVLLLTFSWVNASSLVEEAVDSYEFAGERVTLRFFDELADRKAVAEMLEKHAITDAVKFLEMKPAFFNVFMRQVTQIEKLFPRSGDKCKNPCACYSILESETRRMIGFVWFGPSNQEMQRAEMHMMVHPDFRGQGFGTDARKVFYRDVVTPVLGEKIPTFSPLISMRGKLFPYPLLSVESLVDIDNTASLKTLMKAGAGVLDVHIGPPADFLALVTYPAPSDEERQATGLTDELLEDLLSGDTARLKKVRAFIIRDAIAKRLRGE